VSFIDKVAPDLRAGLEAFPADFLDLSDIAGMRQKWAELRDMLPAPVIEGVSSEDYHVPGARGEPDVLVRVHRPEGREPLPALLWIHGGGFVLGSVESDDPRARSLAKNCNCVVASVEYRLAPEYPFPAPMDDCYAALEWLHTAASELSVDADRIAVGGASAGGGLAAGLALVARDRGEVGVCFQLLIYPMIDHTNSTPSSHAITEPRVWNRESNLLAWEAYLGPPEGRAGVPTYAAPARAGDLNGLPPAYITVGELDLFLDENIVYAQRLLQAGVTSELHVYQGFFHAADVLSAEADTSRRFTSGCEQALVRALHG
jgi:acetyl esterase/lipase